MIISHENNHDTAHLTILLYISHSGPISQYICL